MQLISHRPPNNNYTNNRTTQNHRNGGYRSGYRNGSNNMAGRSYSNNGRNHYDNGDMREYKEPPHDWKKFTELTFRVSNVPSKANVSEMKDAFAAHGTVYKVEFETRDSSEGEQPTGAVFVSFRPVPSTPFWRDAVRFHGKVLQVDYIDHMSERFCDYTDNKRYKLRFHSLRAESLEMGVYQQPEVFVSEAIYTDLVNFIINYQKRNITIEFGVKSSQQYYTFKMEIEFKDIDGEVHGELDDSKQRSRGIITIANKFPARYWMLDNRLQSNNKYIWCMADSWKRKTEIRVKKSNTDGIPLQPHMPDNSEQLGKWVVFRITFDLDRVANTPREGFVLFKEMMQKASEYNLAPKNGINKKPLRIVNGTNLRKYVERSMLNYDVLYMVECNLSFNFLHDYNLNNEFFSLLNDLPTESATYILESIYAKKKRQFDPLSYLRYESMRHVERKPRHVPSYCAMMRKVVVTPTTMYILTPTMETSNRVIRHFHHMKDNFLRVQFVDEASNKVSSSNGTHNDALYNKVFKVLSDGIKIGDRHYEFLAFSSSQLRDHSCWFFAPTAYKSADDVRKWMGTFSTNKSVAKYAARMGQCFSSTRAIARLPVDDIVKIPDVIRNRYTFSDGVGKISYKLSKRVADTLELKTVPSAFQFRLAGYKGVLCQSRFLRNNQIQVRPSQEKFESDHYVLEVIRGSTFIPAYLNRQAITLLSVLGVPDNVFIDLKNAQVNELDKMLKNENNAVTVLHKNIDEHGVAKSLADLVKAGFLQSKDRYLMNLISLFSIMMLRDLKKKAKIRVDKGAFLLGVLDETETLREGQVYCCVSDPANPSSRKVITGPCITYRNPCFHPGDIRVVTAVQCSALSHLVDVVVFPAVGYRDIPSECSGGDLDGDDFTIIYDERLMPKIRNHEPMNYEAPKPDLVDKVTMTHIKQFFVNYILSDQLGMIANAHLAKADASESGAFHGQCIRLAQLHSEAVDFPKTGRPAIFPPELRARSFPDFMEKSDKNSYESKKVLGIMYRSIEVAEFEPYTRLNFDERLYVEGYRAYLENARFLKRTYDEDIRGLMNQFGIMTEFEVVSGFIVNTVTKVDKKKPRDITKSVLDAMGPIKKHYRREFEKEFYGEGTNVVSPEARNRMEAKAFAWYYVTYHPSELGDDASENMITFPWIVHDTLCEIAIRNNNRANNPFQNIPRQNLSHETNGTNGNGTNGIMSHQTTTNTIHHNSTTYNNYVHGNAIYDNPDDPDQFVDDFIDDNDDGMDRLIQSLMK
ncbi:1603_t:CDS:2 [Funneliformis geosporum]|nr:1603_t:CDS:2 [Funneliformis geosporum]